MRLKRKKTAFSAKLRFVFSPLKSQSALKTIFFTPCGESFSSTQGAVLGVLEVLRVLGVLND